MHLERDVASFEVRLNEGGKQEWREEEKKNKLKFSFIIIRAAREERFTLNKTSILTETEICVFETLSNIIKFHSKVNTSIYSPPQST